MSIISSLGVTVTNTPDRSDLREKGLFLDTMLGEFRPINVTKAEWSLCQ